VAHDFNNLLTVVLANVEMAEQCADTKLIELLGAIRQAGLRGAELTRSLLALTRNQTAMVQVLDAREQLHTALPLLSPALGRGIEIVLDLSGEPLPIRMDPSQMQLLLLNMAVNAGDAMPAGGQLTLRAYLLDPSTDPIQRPAELSPGPHVCIEVIDTGTGMEAETARRIFEPFFTTKSKGTGLGLTTCQRIMQAAKGAIHVANTSSQGTTFALLFPQATGAIAKIQADRVHLSPGGTERILVVEDEPSVRSTAARALRERGYRVFEAEDAQVALSVLEREPIDLLFSDVELPGMSGRELADRVNAKNLAAVLLTSGYLDDRSELSAYSFLPKPYTINGLARRVREVLDVRHQ
jgi:CheY-like chemotaxis protein